MVGTSTSTPRPSTGSKPDSGTRPATTGSRPATARPATSNGTGSSTTSRPAGRPQSVNSNRNKVKTKESMKRQSMLNTHRLAPFKYDMNEILEASAMDPAKASSFLASVIAKASRVSTRDAKDFIKTFLEAGDLTKEEYDRICRLLDKYSKYR